MSETQVLGIAITVIGVLVGVIWGVLQTRIGTVEGRAEKLEAQNLAQEVTLGRLLESSRAREDAHAQHREDMSSAVARLEASITELGRKIDRMTGQGTPMPRSYQAITREDKR
jgi:hypothetical protein